MFIDNLLNFIIIMVIYFIIVSIIFGIILLYFGLMGGTEDIKDDDYPGCFIKTVFILYVIFLLIGVAVCFYESFF